MHVSIKNKDIKLNDGTLKIIINAYEKCENKELRERLAKKNTPLTQNERTQIKELAMSMTVAQIARALNRSASAISRILKEGENK